MEEITGLVLYIYLEIDLIVSCEQSWWMKGICLIWSGGRHFSPSLPDRGPTGIWHLAHSISDPRAEISGILVMVRRSSATFRGTTYWFQFLLFSCPRYFVYACATFQTCSYYQKKMKETTALSQGPRGFSSWGESHSHGAVYLHVAATSEGPHWKI